MNNGEPKDAAAERWRCAKSLKVQLDLDDPHTPVPEHEIEHLMRERAQARAEVEAKYAKLVSTTREMLNEQESIYAHTRGGRLKSNTVLLRLQDEVRAALEKAMRIEAYTQLQTKLSNLRAAAERAHAVMLKDRPATFGECADFEGAIEASR